MYIDSIPIYIDVPYWKHENITYQPQETYFTAVLQLGDMFCGGGVPIDHYIIQVDNDTELETTGPTYYISKLPYHPTILMNIAAHSCAGYSDPVTLELHYDQGIVFFLFSSSLQHLLLCRWYELCYTYFTNHHSSCVCNSCYRQHYHSNTGARGTL